MAAKPKLTVEQRQRIADVVSARRALPTDKQLARELGISVSAIYRTIERIEQLNSMLHDLAVSRGTKSGKLAVVWQPTEKSPTKNASGS